MADTTFKIVHRICEEGISRNKAKAEESELQGNKHAAAFYSSIQERYERVLSEMSGRVPPPGALDTLINLNIEESNFHATQVQRAQVIQTGNARL